LLVHYLSPSKSGLASSPSKLRDKDHGMIPFRFIPIRQAQSWIPNAALRIVCNLRIRASRFNSVCQSQRAYWFAQQLFPSGTLHRIRDSHGLSSAKLSLGAIHELESSPVAFWTRVSLPQLLAAAQQLYRTRQNRRSPPVRRLSGSGTAVSGIPERLN